MTEDLGIVDVTPSHTRVPLVSGAGDLRDALGVIAKRKKTILATLLVALCAGYGLTVALGPQYESEAKLLVRVGRENVYKPEVGNDPSQIITSSSEEVLNSEASILTSRDVLTHVLKTIGVANIYPAIADRLSNPEEALHAAVERLERDLVVSAQKKSNVLQVSLSNENPRIAAAALRLIIESFTERHLQAYSDPKSSYLERQLTSYRDRLNTAADRFERYKQENRVFSVEEQRTLLLRQRSELESALRRNRSDIAGIQEQIASLRRSLQDVSQHVSLSTETERYRTVDEANIQLLRLQLREQELLKKYTDTNPLVVSHRKEIETTKAFIDLHQAELEKRMRTGQNVVHQDLQKQALQLEAELPAMKAREGVIQADLRRLDAEIGRVDASEMAVEDLKRDVSVNERAFRMYTDKLAEALTLEDLNQQKSASISVIQEPTIPRKPASPQKALIASIALFLGIGAGLALAFLMELFAPGLSSPARVAQELGVPVFVAVPFKDARVGRGVPDMA